MLTAYTIIFETIFLSIITLIFDRSIKYTALSGFAWAATIYLGIFASLLTNLVWLRAIKRIEASKAVMFHYLIPLFSIISAILTLKELITIYLAIGGLLISAIFLFSKEK